MSKRHLPFDNLPNKKKKTVLDALPLLIEVDFVPLATRGETKIKFIENRGYSRQQKNLLYSSSYNDIKKFIESILQDDYMPPAIKDREQNFIPVSLPVGASIFGRVLVKNRKNSANTPICGDDDWKEYLFNHAILDDFTEKRMTCGNQKTKNYFVPTICKVRLAMVIEPDINTTTSSATAHKSPTSSSTSTKKRSKLPFKFPTNMVIDIIGPCLKKDDQANHSYMYTAGSSDILYSHDFDLSTYLVNNDSDVDLDIFGSDSASECESNMIGSGSSSKAAREHEKDEEISMRLTEFRMFLVQLCIENVGVYGVDKKVIGKKSMLLSSVGKRAKRMQPLQTSKELVDFITKAAKSLKRHDDLHVRFSFGVAQESDDLYDLDDLDDFVDEEDDADVRFSQMSQNEPRALMSPKELSKRSRVNQRDVKEFLLEIYRTQGPWKHGFSEEHMKLWKAKLYSYPEKIKEYKKQSEVEFRQKLMKDLYTDDEIQKECFGYEPAENDYPPINIAHEDPPTLHQWAHRNGKSLKDKDDEAAKLEIELIQAQIKLTETMDANINNNRDNASAHHPSHSSSSTHHPSHSSSSSAVLSRDFVTINIGRKRTDKSVRFSSVYVGENRPIKPSMTLASIQLAKPKLFKKQHDTNDLQASVKIDLDGSLHHHEEEDFGDITLQEIIDVCNFDTSTVPIEIVIEEFTD